MASVSGAPGQFSEIDKAILAIAALVVLLACAVLVGWATGSNFLVSILKGAAAVQPLAALGMGLGGVGLLAATLQWNRLRIGCGLAMALVGAMALLERMSGLSLGVGLLLFPRRVMLQDPMPPWPGMPGNVTSVLFLLLGAALVLAHHRSGRLRTATPDLATGALLITVLWLSFYLLLGSSALQVLNWAFDLPLNSVLAMLGLSIALLALRRDAGWVEPLIRSTGRRRALVFVGPLVAVPVLSAYVANLGVQSGLYEPNVRMLLITSISTIVLVMLVFWVADRLGQGRDTLASMATALDLSPVFCRTLDGRIELWTRGCEALFGWHATEALGQVSHDLFRTAFPRPLKEIEETLRRTGEWRGEVLQRTRNGEWRWMAAQWVLERRGTGEAPRVLETLNDITELKRAGAALRESEQRMAQAVAAYGLAIIEHDPIANHTEFSEEAERIVGVPPGALDSDLQRWLDHVLPEDLERNIAEAEHARRNRLPSREYSARMCRPDGEVRHVHGVVRYSYDPQGVLIGMVVILRDVTEKVIVQENLAARDARMMELQSELSHVSRLSAMGEMAAALAHELNQPLTAVGNFMGVIEMSLGDGEKPPEPRALESARKAAKFASAQALRAGEIVRRLREFIARGEADTRVEDLEGMIEDALALVAPTISGAGVELRREFASDGAHVLADRVQVQQVLVNLVRNALEAMRGADGARVLTVRSTVTRGMAEVSVSDTGPGIEPTIGERLFTPFLSTKNTGMGVGLSICRRIIEAHGGRLWLEPAVRGADFRFTLPVIDPEAEHAE